MAPTAPSASPAPRADNANSAAFVPARVLTKGLKQQDQAGKTDWNNILNTDEERKARAQQAQAEQKRKEQLELEQKDQAARARSEARRNRLVASMRLQMDTFGVRPLLLAPRRRPPALLVRSPQALKLPICQAPPSVSASSPPLNPSKYYEYQAEADAYKVGVVVRAPPGEKQLVVLDNVPGRWPLLNTQDASSISKHATAFLRWLADHVLSTSEMSDGRVREPFRARPEIDDTKLIQKYNRFQNMADMLAVYQPVDHPASHVARRAWMRARRVDTDPDPNAHVLADRGAPITARDLF